jgi:hypothetical protein
VRDAVFTAHPIPEYDPWRGPCVAAATAFLEAGMPPDRVAQRVQRVLDARFPRLRYQVGPDVTSSHWFRRILPASLFHLLVHRYYGLHQPRSL